MSTQRVGCEERPRALLGTFLVGAALLPLLAACDLDRLLDVRDPEFATPESLEDPDALPVLVAGAVSDFQVAYSGMFNLHDEGVVSVTGAFTDELFHSGTFLTRERTDQRRQFPAAQGNTSDITFTMLQRARRSAKDAARSVRAVEGDSDPRLTLLKSLEGFSYVALAENFCSAIPFSDLEDGEWVHGTPLGTQQVLDEALVRFDAALAVAPGSHLAAVGKGRTLLNQGRFQDAASAVSGVPTDFVHFVEHSANTSRQENQLFNLQSNGRWSMSDREGGNGLPFRSAEDPRTPWFEDPSRGFDDAWPLFVSRRYPSRNSNTVLADGIEARLIEAEAALRAGSAGTWLSILNDLRADVGPLMAARYEGYGAFVQDPVLPPLTDPGSDAARVDLMFAERGFWLYLTGHRLGDLRRMIRDYGRSESEVFPSGAFHKGDAYGRDVAFVIPIDEENNPNFHAGLCDPGQA